MTFEDKVNTVIGKPYDAYESHCWDLVTYLVPDAPLTDSVADSLLATVKHFKYELATFKLNEVSEFQNKDIIILGNGDTYFHAGVYYAGGVIHASNEGVVFQDMKNIKQLYTKIKGLRV